MVHTAVSDIRKMTLETFTFKIKRNDMTLLWRIFSFTHKLENAAKIYPQKAENKIIFNTSLTHRVHAVPKARSDIHAVFSQVVCVFMNKVVQKMSVVILITLSDWSLLPCYRQHESNAAYVPVISKNDVQRISGLRASPGKKMVGLERECKVIYEAFGYRFSSLTTWMRSGKRGRLQQLKELETAV
jgi:hypothetical protein